MSDEIKTSWLKDEDGAIFAPKTLVESIQDSSGNSLIERLASAGMSAEVSGTRLKLGTGGGDSQHTYSTEEQIVGKWIDNTNVYEKTFILTEIPSDRNWNTYSLDITISDIISHDVSYHIDLSSYSAPDVIMPLPFFYNSSQYISYQFNGNSFMVKIDSSEAAWRASGSYFKIILRYTK